MSDDLTQFCSPEALLKRSTLAAGNMTIMRLNGEYSKEVWKSNFRQYGQMEKQRWEESEKKKEEERKSEKRKSQKKDDPGARKGRKVAKHCFSNDLWLRRVEK